MLESSFSLRKYDFIFSFSFSLSLIQNLVVKSVMASIASRKRIRDEKEEEEEKEQAILIVISVVTMLLGVIAWYHDKNFVKELARNWELERHSYVNHLCRDLK